MDYENFKEELIEGLKENFEARGIEGMSFRDQGQVNKLSRKIFRIIAVFLFSLDTIIKVAKICISIRYKYKRGGLYDFFSKGHDQEEKERQNI